MRICSRAVALGVVAALLVTGCASDSIHYAHSDLRHRTEQIASIALITVDVTVVREELLSSHLSREWAQIVRANMRSALARYFGTDPRFALYVFDSKDSEEARQELTQVRRIMDALLPYPDAIPVVGVDCLPGPTPALVAAAGTDTLLLAYASDRIKPASTRAAIVALGVPLFLAGMFAQFIGVRRSTRPHGHDGHAMSPLATRDAITLCLVNARTDEVLWFDTRFVGSKDLLDTSDVDAMVGSAYRRFKKASESQVATERKS
jgi:hypothetical protein